MRAPEASTETADRSIADAAQTRAPQSAALDEP